jgi:hypothetical protein
VGLVLIQDQTRWDQFIDKSPHGLLFHKWNFLKTIELHSGYELLPYGIYKGESLICVIPLFYKKIRGLKFLFSPPPQTGVPFLGFAMCRDYTTLKQNKKENFLNIVADEFHRQISKISPHYTHISLVPNLLDIRAFTWNQYSVTPSYTYILDLTETLDNIWNNFQHELRREIKLGEKLYLRLVKSNDVSPLYYFLKERYKEQNLHLPIISKSYLEDLIRLYPEHIVIHYLYDDREIIGVNMTHEYKIFIGWLGAVRFSNAIRSNEYLTWKLIQRAKEKGFKAFELHGANRKNLCQFKTKFNPSLELTFAINQKNKLGQLAEWAYFNLIKRR